MHSIATVMFLLAVPVPGDAVLANEARPLVLALNPQPEPPSAQRTRQNRVFLKSNPQRHKMQQRQDWRKLNPQPEPPRPVYPK